MSRTEALVADLVRLRHRGGPQARRSRPRPHREAPRRTGQEDLRRGQAGRGVSRQPRAGRRGRLRLSAQGHPARQLRAGTGRSAAARPTGEPRTGSGHPRTQRLGRRRGGGEADCSAAMFTSSPTNCSTSARTFPTTRGRRFTACRRGDGGRRCGGAGAQAGVFCFADGRGDCLPGDAGRVSAAGVLKFAPPPPPEIF